MKNTTHTYGVEVSLEDHYYVKAIAELLYSRIPAESRKNDPDENLHQKTARIALKAVEEARKL